jgi:tRNA pseudouridine38-40 synthase
LRYFIRLSYKGKNYHGWQIQPDVVSVQEKINEALSKILGETILVAGAGRTDTGVHASQMFVHLDTNTPLDTASYLYKLNAVLPDDIVAHAIDKVAPDAHARFHATSRSYVYQIYLGRNVFLTDTTWQLYQQKLNLEEMNKAAEILLTHTDFKCFSRSKTDVKTYDCDITRAEWTLDGNLLSFHITANRFLRNMVRAIVGTLVAVGKGKLSLEDFIKIIESRNRSNAGTSAPAKGLTLTNIEYPETIKYAH